MGLLGLLISFFIYVQWPRGTGPLLFLDQTEARTRGPKKVFFLRPRPLLS